MAGRPKQNFEWRGYTGLTKRQKQVLEILENWNYNLKLATAKEVGRKIDVSTEQASYILRKLLEKGLVEKSPKGSYYIIFNKPEEVDVLNEVEIRTYIKKELYDKLAFLMEAYQKTFKETIEEILEKGFEKRKEEIKEKIKKIQNNV